MKFLCVALLLVMVTFVASSEQEVPACLCSRIYAPVCANDGKTYGNKCQFRCQETELQRRAVGRKIDFKIVRSGTCEGPAVPEFPEVME